MTVSKTWTADVVGSKAGGSNPTAGAALELRSKLDARRQQLEEAEAPATVLQQEKKLPALPLSTMQDRVKPRWADLTDTPRQDGSDDVMESADHRFLLTCLGSARSCSNAAALELEDMLEVDEDEDELSAASDSDNGNMFAIDDSDDEAHGDDDELEDAYNFEPEKVADILKRNVCTMAELTEKFQEAMADALDRRLKNEQWSHLSQSHLSTVPSNNPYPAQAGCENRPDCVGDVTGRMTPPEGVGTATDLGPGAETVAQKLEQVRQEEMGRQRLRSSVVKREAISQAMDQAVSRHRRSLVAKASKLEETSGQAHDKIQMAMKDAQRRHRLSISKAAETLDAAGLEDQDDARVGETFSMVCKAMEEARLRHRRSISEAVRKVTRMSASAEAFTPSSMSSAAVPFQPAMSASAEPFMPSSMSVSAEPFTPYGMSIQERIQESVASAHRCQQQIYYHSNSNPYSSGGCCGLPGGQETAGQIQCNQQMSTGWSQASGYGQDFSNGYSNIGTCGSQGSYNVTSHTLHDMHYSERSAATWSSTPSFEQCFATSPQQAQQSYECAAQVQTSDQYGYEQHAGHCAWNACSGNYGTGDNNYSGKQSSCNENVGTYGSYSYDNSGGSNVCHGVCSTNCQYGQQGVYGHAAWGSA